MKNDREYTNALRLFQYYYFFYWEPLPTISPASLVIASLQPPAFVTSEQKER